MSKDYEELPQISECTVLIAMINLMSRRLAPRRTQKTLLYLDTCSKKAPLHVTSLLTMLYNQNYSHFHEMTFIFLHTHTYKRVRKREREREKEVL